MKFMALLKKELREAAPWAALALANLGLWGWYTLVKLSRPSFDAVQSWPSGKVSRIWHVVQWDSLRLAGPPLFFTSIALGFALAVQQFWFPSFFRTWSFSVHRSVTRGRILSAKSIAAALALVLVSGGVWTVIYLMAARPGFIELPPSAKTFWVGWIYVAAGLPAYLATALAGLNTARWYTTRFYPIALAMAVLVIVLMQSSVAVAGGILAVSSVVLAIHVVQTFAMREF